MRRQEILLGDEDYGVKVHYTKRTGLLSLWGSYERYGHIEGGQISLREFLDALEVSDTDLKRVIRERGRG